MLNDNIMLSPISLSMKQMQDLLQAEQSELLLIESNIQNQKRQLLLSTVDETLTRYEKMFCINPVSSATIQERRTALIAKFNSRINTSIVALQEIVSMITSNGCIITQLPSQYSFNVTIILNNPNNPLGLAEIKKQIDMLKPAHLTYSLTMLSDNQINIWTGFEISRYKEMYI